jgi:hypothetical protein
MLMNPDEEGAVPMPVTQDSSTSTPSRRGQGGASRRARMTLYATDHCTLCERALDLLQSMPEARGLALDVVDVAVDDALIERYGPRLPVLAIGAAELDWPFDRVAVGRAIAATAA